MQACSKVSFRPREERAEGGGLIVCTKDSNGQFIHSTSIIIAFVWYF